MTGAGTGTTTVTGAGTGTATRVGPVRQEGARHGESVGSTGIVHEGHPPCGLPVLIALGAETAGEGGGVTVGTETGAPVGSSTGRVGKARNGLCTVGEGEARGRHEGRGVVVVGVIAGAVVGSSTGRVGKL